MVKYNSNMKKIYSTLAFLLVVLNALTLSNIRSVAARDKGDDIILTKGKLIMRGGKGKGNLILDTGSKSSEGHHEMMHMPPMMSHFNPYSFYPMQHHQQHQPMIIHPVYLEDHSAMQQHHHHPEQHHEHHEHHEYQHHEEPHYEHHGEEYQHHHEEPHHEMHHHEHQPHHVEMQHHEPMGHHYGYEGHAEEEGGHYGGHETHPIMQFVMHGGSRLQTPYQQMTAMQAFEHPSIYAHQIQPHFQDPQSVENQIQQHQQQQHQQQHQQSLAQSEQKGHDIDGSSSTDKQVKQTSSLIHQAANNPLVAIIKPLLKRTPLLKQKKP